MRKRLFVQVIAAIVVGVFAVGIWSTGDEFELGWLRFFSVAVLACIAAIALWEHVLWRIRLVQRFPQVTRDISGTWKGSLESFWVDPETGRCPPAKTVFLVVRQTAESITVVLLTEESRSVSSLATITDDRTTASLDYIYLNRPDSRVEHRSRMHHGSASLDVVGRPATRLRGRYWTDRDSRGELVFTERRSHRADDYREAGSLFGVAGRTNPG